MHSAERQDGLELLPVGADIAAREPEHAPASRHQLGVVAGIEEGQPRRLDDVGRAPVRSVRILAAPLLARPMMLAVSRRQRRPATRAAAIDAENQNPRECSSERDNTNKIPIAKR